MMPIQDIKECAERSLAELEEKPQYKSGDLIEDKLRYLREVEVIKGLLQTLIFWCDSLLSKTTVQKLEEPDDTIW